MGIQGKETRQCKCGCGLTFTVDTPEFKKDYFNKAHRKHAEYIRRKIKQNTLPNPALAPEEAKAAQ